MRPVTVPATPPATPPAPTYDEDTQLAVVVDTTDDDMAVDITKRDRTIELAELINTWIAAGCPVRAGNPAFSNVTDASDFKTWSKQLKARDMAWGDARRALIQSVGAYCSYCSAPIFSHLAIEHVLPKNTFPQSAFAWPNFLLACSTCNSVKGNKPNQATIPGAPKSTADTKNYITNQGALNYLWPHYDWTQIMLPAPFPFRNRLMWGTFSDRTGEFSGTEEITKKDEEQLYHLWATNQLSIDRWVYYVPGERMRSKRYFAVALSSDPAFSDTIQDAVRNIIDLMSLNRVAKVKDSSSTVDRRLFDRTNAWFRAMYVRKELEHARLTDKQARDVFPAALEQAKLTIQATGYWGVWLQVLGRNKITRTQQGQQLIRGCLTGTADIDWSV
jgi:hypothetical protein